MPFINTKYSQKITPEQETELKTALGSAVSILGKTESWLMLGFEQECSCLLYTSPSPRDCS